MRNGDDLDEMMFGVRLAATFVNHSRRACRALALFAVVLTLAQTSYAQTGSLSGSVVSDPGEKPIANAEILFTDLKLAVRSDAKGNFLISGVSAGEHALVVRGIGFEAFEGKMTFRYAQKVEADFMLKSTSTKLARVVVRDTIGERYHIKLAEFEERRRLGIGRFITAELFDKNASSNMSQLLMRNIPGMITVGKGSKQIVSGQRNGADFCPVQVILNGVVRYNGSESQGYFDVNSLFAGEVIGVEYYTVATTPLQYNSTAMSTAKGGASYGAPCGTIIIWTKG